MADRSLEQRGARVVHGPTIATITVGDGELRAQTERMIDDPPDCLVATTGATRRMELVIGGVKLMMQGTAVTVEGTDTVHLSEREHALLCALMERAGQVIPRTTLLRQVWGSNKADPHTLEVTVARLRRRLGEAGQGLKAVPRRGYVLAVG